MKTILVVTFFALPFIAQAERPDLLRALDVWNMESEYGHKLPAANKRIDYPTVAEKYLAAGTYEGHTSSKGKKCTVDVKMSSGYFEATILGGQNYRQLARTVITKNVVTQGLEKNGVMGVTIQEDKLRQSVFIGKVKNNLELVIDNWGQNGGSTQHCQKLLKVH